jgi:predicted nucleotidyltransferase
MITKKHSLKNSQREKIVNRISSYLIERYGEIIAVYLYGSFNTAGQFSDIDLAILVDSPPDDPLFFEINLETELEKVVKYQVDVRILNQAPLSFCQEVIRSGTVLVDRRPNLRADFQGKVLKQYFDFTPFRRRYLYEVVNAPI